MGKEWIANGVVFPPESSTFVERNCRWSIQCALQIGFEYTLGRYDFESRDWYDERRNRVYPICWLALDDVHVKTEEEKIPRSLANNVAKLIALEITSNYSLCHFIDHGVGKDGSYLPVPLGSKGIVPIIEKELLDLFQFHEPKPKSLDGDTDSHLRDLIEVSQFWVEHWKKTCASLQSQIKDFENNGVNNGR